MIALLDTHALIWWVSGDKRLPRSHKRVIKAASAERPLLVAQISLWEIAMLVTFNRIRLDRPLRDWLEAATAPPLVETVGISTGRRGGGRIVAQHLPRRPGRSPHRRDGTGDGRDAAHGRRAHRRREAGPDAVVTRGRDAPAVRAAVTIGWWRSRASTAGGRPALGRPPT
ncbi:MAG: hypothetical protein IPN17_35120 [Deltaproteobacteria bacterium]|nr:hypothetical protein [Deltaproteobacteria bacterium]